MSYELLFPPSALREWRKLGETVRTQFKMKLAEQLEMPHVPADRLDGSEMKDCYKIKLAGRWISPRLPGERRGDHCDGHGRRQARSRGGVSDSTKALTAISPATIHANA